MRDVGLSLQKLEEKAHHIADFGSFISGSLGTLWDMMKTPEIPLKINELNDEMEELKVRYRKFHWKITKLLARHKEGIVEEQLDVRRISRMAIALYTSTAVIIKYENDAHFGAEDGVTLAGDLAKARYYLHLACKRFDNNVEELKQNNDQETYKLADFLTGL
jgi:hypothetical protein